jgi:adenylate cyclase
MDDRSRLEARLRAAGLTDDEIARAAAGGRLPTLAVELTLGGMPRHTLTELAAEVGLPTGYLRELLQAAGRPNPRRGERVFTQEDIDMARLVRTILDSGLPRADVLEVARVLGQGTSQMAESVRRIAGNALLRPGDTEASVGLRYAEAADQLGPAIPALLGYGFRTQLRDRISAHLVTEAEREAGKLRGTRDVAIAFADLVNYTELGESLDAEDVGRIAGELARLATRALRTRVQLVKTIGDAAMFVSRDPEALVATVGDLRTAVSRPESGLPDVRAGIAYGPATTHGGDWFGSTVNLASRITGAARPGQILASEEVCERTSGSEWRKRRRRSFKGVDGRPRLYSLESWSGHTPAGGKGR